VAHRNFFEHVGIDDSAAVQGKSHVQEIKEPKNENQLPAIKASSQSHIQFCPPPGQGT
jgi:hypothetical protein